MKRLMRMFATYDVNGDGYIDKRSFKDMLQQIAPGLFVPGTVDKLVDSADAQGEGVIHYAEFLAWVFNEISVTERIVRVASDF